MEYVAYTILILALAAPAMLVAAFSGLLIGGVIKIISGRRNQHLNIIGVVMVAAALIGGVISYQWLRGPRAQLATLQPLVIDRSLAANLPKTWVLDYGLETSAFDLLRHKYASRVLYAEILDFHLRALIPAEKRGTFMEEIKLVNSPSCADFIASGDRDYSQVLKCVTISAVSKARVLSDGPYITQNNDKINDARIVNFGLTTRDGTRQIARCIGRAPRESNPILSMIRRNRSLEVASSIYKCKIRAASGALSRVVATGAIS